MLAPPRGLMLYSGLTWGLVLFATLKAVAPHFTRFARIDTFVLALCAAGVFALPAHAQQQQGVEERGREVQEDIERSREVDSTAQESLDLSAFGDGPLVTYQQILADPDNIELNIRYALTQIRDGNVRGAGATLERILLIRPELATVRVLFAIVLFRLDNLDEAERELRAVRELNMPDDLRAQIDDYLDQIETRRKRTKFVLAVNFSTQYDWNRNASPKSETRLAFNIPTRTSGTSARQDDLSLNALAQLSFEHDLGAQKRHLMIGGLVYYQGEQIQQDDLDLHALSADFGYKLDFAPHTITPRILYDNVLLSREKYLQAVGGSVDWNYASSNTFNVFATGQVKYNYYNNITGNAVGTERSGRSYEAELGFTQVLDPTQRIRTSFKRARTDAARRFNAFDRTEIAASHTWLFEDGDFLLSSLTLNHDTYDIPETAISSDTRSDKSARLRLTYGVPFSALGDDVPKVLDGVTMTFSAEAFQQFSNITNFSYKNYRFAVGVNRRWEF